MEFKELLSIGRDLKKEGCYIVRDCLEKVQELDIQQLDIIYSLVKNDVYLETAIQGVWNGCYTVHENFYNYIDNLLYETCDDLPDFIELDYLSMWFRTFRYDEHLYIDWQEWAWSKNRDEYGTNEQKKLYRDYIRFNLECSSVIDFYY